MCQYLGAGLYRAAPVEEIERPPASQLFAATGATGPAVQRLGHDIAMSGVQGGHVRRDNMYASVTVGDPRDGATLVGPLIDRAAYEAMRAFASSGASFDAVVGASDVIAMSAIRAITASGLAVPVDVAVVGFDDVTMAAHVNPPLTSVRQDFRRGAHTLVDVLLRRMGGEETPSVAMPAELIVRESSASASGGRRRI